MEKNPKNLHSNPFCKGQSMKRLTLILTVILANASLVSAQTVYLGSDWSGIGDQTDPFDSSAIEVNRIVKGDFNLDCDYLTFLVEDDADYDRFLRSAEIQYRIDGGTPVVRDGVYTTIYSGSFADIIDFTPISGDRYFSFKINDADVTGLKAGYSLVVSGRKSTGWVNAELNLMGFTKAYKRMCELAN